MKVGHARVHPLMGHTTFSRSHLRAVRPSVRYLDAHPLHTLWSHPPTYAHTHTHTHFTHTHTHTHFTHTHTHTLYAHTHTETTAKTQTHLETHTHTLGRHFQRHIRKSKHGFHSTSVFEKYSTVCLHEAREWSRHRRTKQIR